MPIIVTAVKVFNVDKGKLVGEVKLWEVYLRIYSQAEKDWDLKNRGGIL